MAGMKQNPRLSIIIPTLNEANQLPSLMADLGYWPSTLQIIVVDGGSSDSTSTLAKLAGAKVLHLPKANRGSQLHYGATNSKGHWLLFLHADSRLTKDWPKVISKIINNPSSEKAGWYFNFKIKEKTLSMHLLEIAVALRSNLLKRPYGDQGLLINKTLYDKVGGFASLYLMEDLDFLLRLKSYSKVRNTNLSLYTSARRWKKTNILLQAFINARLRYRWRRGESTKSLSAEYYQKDER